MKLECLLVGNGANGDALPTASMGDGLDEEEAEKGLGIGILPELESDRIGGVGGSAAGITLGFSDGSPVAGGAEIPGAPPSGLEGRALFTASWNKENKTCVLSMILSARPTVPIASLT